MHVQAASEKGSGRLEPPPVEDVPAAGRAVPQQRAPELVFEISVPARAPSSSGAAAVAEETSASGPPQGLEEQRRSELAQLKAELRAELARDVALAARELNGPSASVLVVLAGMNLLLVTGVLALARSMPAWEAGILMTALLWLIAGAALLVHRRHRRRSRVGSVWERAWRAAERGLDGRPTVPHSAHFPKEQQT